MIIISERRKVMGKWSWSSSTSEEELRAISREMQSALDNMDYDSDEYTQLSIEHVDVVNEIASRCAGKLPRREHGWYLPNDD